jgi:hypothetical protein
MGGGRQSRLRRGPSGGLHLRDYGQLPRQVRAESAGRLVDHRGLPDPLARPCGWG